MPRRLLAFVLPLLFLAAGAFAAPPADPGAAAFFAEVVKAFRSHPGVKGSSSVEVSVEQGGQEAGGQEVELELLYAGDRRGVLRLRGFECRLVDGEIVAIHDTTKDTSYFRSPDGGSPYYALLTSFVDMPFPELALAFGEDDPAEVLMQLHPSAPTMQPVAVEDAALADGTPVRRIRLAGEHEKATLDVDPRTLLPRAMELVVTGGPFAPAGATLTYAHAFDYAVVERPDAAALAMDPGRRQRVDLLAALVKAPPPPAPGEGAPAGQGGAAASVHALVGKPVPAVRLDMLDGAPVDLAAQQGRVVVLDFWATWCGPCRAALPRLHEVARRLKDDQLPVDVYAVNVWERTAGPEARLELVRSFWNDAKYTLPVLIDEGGAAAQFRISGIPTTVIVRSDGVVHAAHVGFNADAVERDVREAIAALEKP